MIKLTQIDFQACALKYIFIENWLKIPTCKIDKNISLMSNIDFISKVKKSVAFN